jgi:Ion channel
MPATLLAGLAGLLLIGTALLDAFETIVLPRRISRRLRLARYFYLLTWRSYAALALKIKDEARRETFLSFYGPSSLLLLVALWAIILVIGFATLHWASGSELTGPDRQPDFWTDAYFSGTTFFTLGLGDLVPGSDTARLLTVVEGGTGFAFLALLIGYLPIVYQMFARRETNVSLLDQRAGSPPSAAELIRRNVDRGDVAGLIVLLHDWEIWVADLLESHLSYSTLAYFRSQHENQSWVAALALILDVSAYLLACGQTKAVRQAGFTFAVGRHAVGDLTNVFNIKPHAPSIGRLDARTAERLWQVATDSGLLDENSGASQRLTAIRSTYEPYLQALAEYLLMDLPPWVPAPDAQDNWETTAWDFTSPVTLLGNNSPFRKS